jgi:hypothetical protein
MKNSMQIALAGAAVIAGILAPSAANAYVPPPLEIPVTCGEATTTGPTDVPVYTGQEVTLVFSPTGCDEIYWTVEPSNWPSVSGNLATQTSFTISAADVPAQFGQQFDVDKTGNGDYEQIVLVDGGPAPEPRPEPTPEPLADTGLSVGAISSIGALLGITGAVLVVRSRRTKKS